ncbi:MAG: biotin--[acetyl-CoA-carboxylase] ligase [Candidatus Accumulibacter sp.]|jgi:BirA family biotin operon repressor/biotin-[acetyl-CoA-carboxylase] ligase|nr:biotin--[acetyl-CoA-carboxylase] ligase [Accumulibacter sp.]
MAEFLSGSPKWPARFLELLGSFRDRFTIDVLPTCESTSVILLERAELGAPSGSVIVAENQTAGKGSRGRSWTMRPGDGLAFSILWHFQRELGQLAGLSLAVGVAIARALNALGAQGVSLKWPNDILSNDAKLGGVLIDLQEAPMYSFAVIGIGINLHIPDDIELSGFALPPAALDALLSPLPDAGDLLAALLIELAKTLDVFSARGFSHLCDEWRKMNAWQDRAVRLLNGSTIEKEGVCVGADADGALLIRTSDGIERCLSGDLTLRAV